jgi:hypothetical protein
VPPGEWLCHRCKTRPQVDVFMIIRIRHCCFMVSVYRMMMQPPLAVLAVVRANSQPQSALGLLWAQVLLQSQQGLQSPPG